MAQEDKQTSRSTSQNSGTGTRGGTHEQHVEAGRQSHKNESSNSGARNTSNAAGSSDRTSTRGGTHEQHVEAGRQSHKNERSADDAMDMDE